MKHIKYYLDVFGCFTAKFRFNNFQYLFQYVQLVHHYKSPMLPLSGGVYFLCLSESPSCYAPRKTS